MENNVEKERNSIEETTKIIERKIKEAKNYSDITGLCLTLDEELRNALMHILSDYKRVLKENEEWQRAYQEEKDRQFNLIRKSQKKDEIINLMAEKIFEEGIVWENEEEVKKYFENKIEESEE